MAMFITELLRKWFGLENPPNELVEVLKAQLDRSERERGELLRKLLEKDKPEPVSQPEEEPIPIQPAFVPWRVRQQQLEAEDRKKAQQILKEREKEIAKLEEELGVKDNGDRAVG